MIISPFVEIVSGRLDEVVDNKFAGGKIAPETLERFIAGYAPSHAFNRKLRKSSHTTMLSLPAFFAMPTNSAWEEFENVSKWNKESVEEIVGHYAGEQAIPRTQNQGYSIYLPRTSTPGESKGTLMLYAHNTGDCKLRAGADHDAPKRLDPEMLVGVARRTPDEGFGVESLLQAADDAEMEATLNVESGHGRPVYLVSFGATKWLYGVFVIEGSVRVSGAHEGVNEITPSDYEAYLASCKMSGAPGRVVSHEELTKKLSDNLELVSRRFEGKKALLYPRKYVVAKLYLPDAGAPGFDLPEASLSTPGGLLLCEGLMRMVLGDEVLSWSKEQAEMAYLLGISVNKGGAGADGEPLLRIPRRLSWCLEALLGPRVEPAQAIDAALEESADDFLELFRLAPEDSARVPLLKKIVGAFPRKRLRELLEETLSQPEPEEESPAKRVRTDRV